jgi:hypothetical protein
MPERIPENNEQLNKVSKAMLKLVGAYPHPDSLYWVIDRKEQSGAICRSVGDAEKPVILDGARGGTRTPTPERTGS